MSPPPPPRPGVPWARWLLLVVPTAAVTVALGAIEVPSPALFAGLVVAAALASAGRAPAEVPVSGSAAAQAVIGVVIGLLARPDTLATVAASGLPVLAISLATLLVSMGAGLLMGLQRGVTALTGMLSMTAGGASGLVAVSRELGGDERMVAVVQYLRVGLIMMAMPLVASLAFGAQHDEPGPLPPGGPAAPWWTGLAATAGCVVTGYPPARLLRIPAGALIGPMTVAVVVGTTGLAGPGLEVPGLLVDVAYAAIGWQAGLRFTREALVTVARVLPLATALIMLVVALCAGLGLVLSATTGMTPLEGYLATTPGGVYAVLATAISAGADVTAVVAVQVLRVLVMLLLAPWIARLVGGWTARRR